MLSYERNDHNMKKIELLETSQFSNSKNNTIETCTFFLFQNQKIFDVTCLDLYMLL